MLYHTTTIMVIQRMQALSKMIGRKASINDLLSLSSNPKGLTGDENYQVGIQQGADEISNEVVKCVEINWKEYQW